MNKQSQKKLVRICITLALAGFFAIAQNQGWLKENKTAVLSSVTTGTYKVVEFSDGDTFAVNIDGKKESIRLIGVDTPETHDPRKEVQCFGKAASAFTKELIGTQAVRLENDPTNSNRDRYNRLLRYVYLPDNRLVNAEIIRQGYGFAYTFFPFTKLEEFRALENEAKEKKLGLWSSCSTILEPNGAIRTNDDI